MLVIYSIVSVGSAMVSCDFLDVLGRTQSTVSHHLSLLVDAGLLTREQRGKWAWFRLDEARLDSVRAALAT